MKVTTVLGAVAVILAMASVTMGDLTNTRPVAPVGNSLQTVLNNITVSGPAIDDVNSQSDVAVFTSQASGGAVASFIIALSAKADTNRFGLYDYSTGNKAEVFVGSPAAGTSALIEFFLDGSISVNGVQKSGAGTFGSTFGFYLDVYELTQAQGGDDQDSTLDATWYTEDSRNGGNAQALVYQGNNQTTVQIPNKQPGLFTDTHWIFAWEQGPVGGQTDKDYDDLVVIVESINPAIPAPGAALLIGLGLSLIGWFKRRIA